MADFATIQRYLSRNPQPPNRPTAAKVLDLLVKNKPREKWMLRGASVTNDNGIDEDCKPSSAKKQKHNPNNCIAYSVLAQKEIGLKVASFLDPQDIPNFLQLCKVTWEALATTDQLLEVRLQSVFGYFSVLQHYADQLIKLQYSGEELVRFFTHLAETMQKIYGQRYTVHPIHRALVAEHIVREICGANYYEDQDEDDPVLGWDNPNRPLFHPRAPKQTLRDRLLFTQFHRFSWSVVLGDHYYSFSRCDVIEYGHGEGWIDLNIKENVLDENQCIYLFMYIDEDNFSTSGIQNTNNLLYVSASDQFKSLAHYYVFGERRGPYDTDDNDDEIDIGQEYDSDDEYDPDDNPKVKQSKILDRLHWLYQRKLVDCTEEDWKAILEVAGKEESDFKTHPLAVVIPGSFPKPQPKPPAEPEPAQEEEPEESISPLTPYEEDRLTDAINNLSQERLVIAIQIIRESLLASGKLKEGQGEGNDSDEDEIDVDLEQLDAASQRRLFRHVFGGDHLPDVRGKGLMKRPT